MKTAKKVIYISWVVVVIAIFLSFLLSPRSFRPESLANFLQAYESHLLLIYCAICILRGLFLVPSTPFVLAGALLFPDLPVLVISVSMVGVIIGSTAVYYFSDILGFSEELERKFPKKIEGWQRRLNSPRAMLIVIGWSFFPLVPTDIICYAAGIVKMPYKYLISGVIIGEVVLIALYVYYGPHLLQVIL